MSRSVSPERNGKDRSRSRSPHRPRRFVFFYFCKKLLLNLFI